MYTQGKVEAKHGVSGYRETQEALENVSALKSELDQMKGRTLEDISYMVQQLTKKIADKVGCRSWYCILNNSILWP